MFRSLLRSIFVCLVFVCLICFLCLVRFVRFVRLVRLVRLVCLVRLVSTSIISISITTQILALARLRVAQVYLDKRTAAVRPDDFTALANGGATTTRL